MSSTSVMRPPRRRLPLLPLGRRSPEPFFPDFPKTLRILINGNLGYIGPVLIQHLRRVLPAARLVGFDTGFFAGCLIDQRSFPEAMLDVQHFGDVRRLPAEVLEGVDVVIQLAAISNDPMGNAFEGVTAEINARAVVENARRAKAAGAKTFVFASSCSVYGAGGEGAKSETSELNPLTAYARSKIAAEQGLRPLGDAGFKITCLRFATACGFSPRLRLDLVLNDFVASALSLGRIVILSDGTPWRPLIHVKDMARAMEWAIIRPAERGGTFLLLNVGSNQWNYQVKELADAVRAELGNVEISINQQAAPDKRSYRVDFGLFATLAPDHQPLETLTSTVQGLVAGLKASGFNDPDF